MGDATGRDAGGDGIGTVAGGVDYPQPLRDAVRNPFLRDGAAINRLGEERSVGRTIEIIERTGRWSGFEMTEPVLAATQMNWFRAWGSNLFVTEPELEALLERSELDNLRVGDLRLPHPTSYVAFGPRADLAVPGEGGVRFDGAYVTYDEVSLMVTLTRSPRARATGEPRPAWPGDDDTTTVRAKVADETRPLGDVVDRDLATSVYDEEQKALIEESYRPGYKELYVAQVEASAEARKSAASVIRRAVMLALNVLCYVSARGADARVDHGPGAPAALVGRAAMPGRPGHKARKRLLDEGHVPTVVVGGEIARAVRGDATGTGTSPSAHARRGHIRWQRCGPSLSRVEPRWIKPTTVNGGVGPGRTYDVRRDASPTEPEPEGTSP